MPDMQRILRRAEGHWADPRRPDEPANAPRSAPEPEDRKPDPAVAVHDAAETDKG